MASNFWSNNTKITESTNVQVIEIKHFQLNNTLIKLDHI